MRGGAGIADVQAYRQTLLRAYRGAFRSDEWRANVSEAACSAVGGRRFAAPFRQRFFNAFRVCLGFLSIGLVYVKRERAFFMEFCGRVRLARLANAAELFFITVVYANDFYSHFAVQGLQFFVFRLGFLIVFRAPFRDA